MPLQHAMPGYFAFPDGGLEGGTFTRKADIVRTVATRSIGVSPSSAVAQATRVWLPWLLEIRQGFTVSAIQDDHSVTVAVEAAAKSDPRTSRTSGHRVD